MAGINSFIKRLGTFGFQAAPTRVELLKNVNTHEIRGRLTATVTIAGGNNDITLVAEGIQRLLSRLRLVHDGVEVVQPVTGRILYQLGARSVAALTAATNLTVNTAGAVNVAMDFIIPLAWKGLSDPILTCLPGTLPVEQELALYFEFEQGAANAIAGTTAGSGAFGTGGTDSMAVTNVALTLEQEYSSGLVVPWYLPRIQVKSTVQYAAANAELVLDVNQRDPYWAVLFSQLQGALQNAQDGINFVTFEAGAVRYIDREDGVMLQRRDQAMFPAAVTAIQTGRYFIRHADNGRLGSAVVPAELPDPRYTFDVDAPTGAPGVIQAVFLAGVKRPGITRP